MKKRMCLLLACAAMLAVTSLPGACQLVEVYSNDFDSQIHDWEVINSPAVTVQLVGGMLDVSGGGGVTNIVCMGYILKPEDDFQIDVDARVIGPAVDMGLAGVIGAFQGARPEEGPYTTAADIMTDVPPPQVADGKARIWYHDGALPIVQNVMGERADIAYNTDQWYHITLIKTGVFYTLKVDDVEILSDAGDGSAPTGGFTGLLAHQDHVQFDNFVLKATPRDLPLIYSTDFSTPDTLDDWVIEKGSHTLSIDNGMLKVTGGYGYGNCVILYGSECISEDTDFQIDVDAIIDDKNMDLGLAGIYGSYVDEVNHTVADILITTGLPPDIPTYYQRRMWYRNGNPTVQEWFPPADSTLKVTTDPMLSLGKKYHLTFTRAGDWYAFRVVDTDTGETVEDVMWDQDGAAAIKGGKVGLATYTGTARFDNFELRAVPAGGQIDPLPLAYETDFSGPNPLANWIIGHDPGDGSPVAMMDGGALRCYNGTGTWSYLYAGATLPPEEDFDVEADVTIDVDVESGTVGLVGGWIDGINYTAADILADDDPFPPGGNHYAQTRVYYLPGGEYPTQQWLAFRGNQPTYSIGEMHTLKLTRRGDIYTFYVDGINKFCAIDATGEGEPRGGTLGLILHKDNVLVHRFAIHGTVVGPTVVDNLTDAKALEDDTLVKVENMVATVDGNALLSGPAFYMEDEERSAGIRVFTGNGSIVPSGPVSEGDIVTVEGVMATGGGERYIDASTVTVTGSRTPLKPLALSNRSLGGGPSGLQIGVDGGTGLNNIGLLVKVWGRVTATDYDGIDFAFWLDDGSGVPSDMGYTGVKVYDSEIFPFVGEYYEVIGISTLQDTLDGVIRMVMPRYLSDKIELD